MRQHEIVCTVTGEKESQYLQYIQDTINTFTVMHIEKCIHEAVCPDRNRYACWKG